MVNNNDVRTKIRALVPGRPALADSLAAVAEKCERRGGRVALQARRLLDVLLAGDGRAVNLVTAELAVHRAKERLARARRWAARHGVTVPR